MKTRTFQPLYSLAAFGIIAILCLTLYQGNSQKDTIKDQIQDLMKKEVTIPSSITQEIDDQKSSHLTANAKEDLGEKKSLWKFIVNRYKNRTSERNANSKIEEADALKTEPGQWIDNSSKITNEQSTVQQEEKQENIEPEEAQREGKGLWNFLKKRYDSRIKNSESKPLKMEHTPANRDTQPDPEKIAQLEKQLEEKSLELEALSRQLEKEFESKISQHTSKLEELSLQLEKRISERMKNYENNGEIDKLTKEMEAVALKLEKKMAERMKDIEASIDEERIEESEKKIEELARQIEEQIDSEGKYKDQKRVDQLQTEIRAETKRLEEISREMVKGHKDLASDPEVQELSKQMSDIQRQLEQQYKGSGEIWDDESKAIQAEMRELEVKITELIKPIQTEIQQALADKSAELAKLAQELEKERRKGN